MPNVKKSTLFNALTKASIKAANFPFCTIKPNTGVVPMPNPRLNQLAKIVKPQRTLPTTIKFVNIASLVKSASKSKSLSNQFLTNIRKTKAISHVVRCFKNNNIIHVSSKVNPANNIKVINTKLALANLNTCKRAIHRVQKKAKSSNNNAKAKLAVLKKCLPQLKNASMLRALNLSAKKKAAIRYLSFLTLKPTMYIANVNKNSFKNNPYLNQVRKIAAKKSSVVVPVCAAVKADIAELNNKKRNKFMQKLKLKKPSLNRVIRASYKLLNLQTYFTAKVKKVRA